MSEINGKAPDNPPEPENFVGQCQATDVGVSEMLAQGLAHGLDKRAVAAGGLHAVVRFHVQAINGPRTERHYMSVMIPAMARAIREVIAAEEEREASGG